MRTLLMQLLISCSVVILSLAPLRSDEPNRKTYVYKKVGDLEIKADVFQYNDDQVRPVIVWIHGGALINGHRGGINGRVLQMAVEEGYVLVSIDYRLAPETKLPAIIEDVEDAFGWLRKSGPELFHIDPERMAVIGGSAGGYLTLTAGFRVDPRPKVLVAFWGYGDLVGDWYSKPSPHPRHFKIKLNRDEAWNQVSGPPISDSRRRKGNGSAFYQYCRQHGTWPTAVTGWDPAKETEKFFPYMAVKQIDADYPPTVLLHGTEDTDVPHEQSVMMVRELKRHGIAHEFISVDGGEHGLWGVKSKDVDAAHQRVFEFVKQQL